jgi:hypothetical protein
MDKFYDVGDTAEITAEFTNDAGVYIDPSALSLKITDPDGAVVTRIYQDTTHIVRDEVGKFHCNHPVDKQGTWEFEWVTSGATGASVQKGDFFVRIPAVITVRTTSNKDTATSFATFGEIETIIHERPDYEAWFLKPIDQRKKLIVTAYRDLNKLVWSSYRGYSQNREYWQDRILWEPNDPPVDDPEFAIAIRRAQAAQAMYLCLGSQVRDMAREGVILTRALMGAEMEISGYKGPVCAEAIECIGRWVDLMPRLKRMR